MIPRQDKVAWQVDHPWPEFDQVEQDLLLSQAICAIANDELLGSELALRGGTAFHKMFLPEPLRYSEDLDYVRSTEGGIGEIMRRLTDLGAELGFRPSTKMGKFPKVLWKYKTEGGRPARIKVEINTFERSPMLGFDYVSHHIESPYCKASAEVKTFKVEELAATKLRALYQRSKGRDLFDLWLVLTALGTDPEAIIAAFPAYRPEGTSGQMMKANLAAKLDDEEFVSDIKLLVRSDDLAYDPRAAAELVSSELFAML
ncbi:MAG: nucleotidyl transferase AbiEii/AbiGii toxin family protein [Eggerthellaceae bacterium]|nr:nucleotidyl transferase AbiEii/AbiGii toxin family protein [Eggerthellaceae bacterium]